MYGLDKSHYLVDESTSRELNYYLFYNKVNSHEILSFSIPCNLFLNLSNDDALNKYFVVPFYFGSTITMYSKQLKIEV